MPALAVQPGESILLVVNRNDAASREIGEYYRPRRSVPVRNVCSIATDPAEEISWKRYEQEIEQPVAQCLLKANLQETVLYIVTTLGVPLKVEGSGRGMQAEYASVDSELSLLYGKLKGQKFRREGWIVNPFFAKRDAPFRHPEFPMYLVTRLAA